MKAISHMLLLSQSVFSRNTGQVFHGNVRRYMSGKWLDSMMPRHRRDAIDGVQGFNTLAVMMAYAGGFGADETSPLGQNGFNNEITRLKDLYTNYGCYCWIDGVDAGVIGGGKTKDMSDHHCKELYRCYKCVNIDYDKNYTDVSYNVDFSTDSNGDRTIDCSDNGQSDAANICECDKRFAEDIAATVDGCDAGTADDGKFGPYCMDEDLRTITGKNVDTGADGTFDSRNTCEKAMPEHSKDQCCGLYPDRVPYDSNFAECCELRDPIEDILKFKKLQAGECRDLGGRVVVSVKGDPSSYVGLGASAFAPGPNGR